MVFFKDCLLILYEIYKSFFDFYIYLNGLLCLVLTNKLEESLNCLCNVKGTDLWEANLRNGGQPPPRVEKTTPWGSHTPASNIGGTWGVDDDIGDTNNMWNPQQSQWPAGPNQPQQQPPMWTGGA